MARAGGLTGFGLRGKMQAMPYTGPEDPSLPDNVKALPQQQRAMWLTVYNQTYRNCTARGGQEATCDQQSIRNANTVAFEDDLKTETIQGVDLLSVGVWRGIGCPDKGCQFTEQDLDGIVAAARVDSGSDRRAPVKLGHGAQGILKKSGLPAAGWVTNLRRIGDRIVGDLADVPRQVAELIRAGAWKNRSVELSPMTIAGRNFPQVLTGLALLGVDAPAVENLDDIAGMYTTLDIERPTHPWGSLVLQQGGEIGDTGEASTKGGVMDRKAIAKLLGLAEDTPEEELLAALTKHIAASKASEEENDEDEEYEEEEEEEEETDEPLGEIAAMRTQMEAMRKESAKSQGRIVQLETDKLAAQAVSAVEAMIRSGRAFPAQREALTKFATASPVGVCRVCLHPARPG